MPVAPYCRYGNALFHCRRDWMLGRDRLAGNRTNGEIFGRNGHSRGLHHRPRERMRMPWSRLLLIAAICNSRSNVQAIGRAAHFALLFFWINQRAV